MALYLLPKIFCSPFFFSSQYSSWCYINVWLSQVTEHRGSILTIQEVLFCSLIFYLHTWKMRFYEDGTWNLDLNQKVNKTKTLWGDDSFSANSSKYHCWVWSFSVFCWNNISSRNAGGQTAIAAGMTVSEDVFPWMFLWFTFWRFPLLARGFWFFLLDLISWWKQTSADVANA